MSAVRTFVAPLLLVLSSGAYAAPNLSADEMALLRAFRATAGEHVNLTAASLRRLLQIEEMVRRKALVTRCKTIDRSEKRLLDNEYWGFVREVVKETRVVVDERSDPPYARSYDEAALLWVARNENRKDFLSFLQYLNSEQGRADVIRVGRVNTVEEFFIHFHTDVNTGAPLPNTIHWLVDHLRESDLLDSFVRALNGRTPSLGSRMASFAATPVPRQPAPAWWEERDRLVAAIEALLHVEDGAAHLQYLPPEALAALDRWYSHAFMADVSRVFERLRFRSQLPASIARELPNRSTEDDRVDAFVKEVTGGSELGLRSYEKLDAIISAMVAQRCAG